MHGPEETQEPVAQGRAAAGAPSETEQDGLEVVEALVVRAGEDPMAAWGRMPKGTKVALVRFEGDDLPLEHLQRLARKAEVWADARPQDPDDAVDLAVAGAGAVIAWYDAMPVDALRAIGEALGPTFILGTRPATLEQAVGLADELHCLLLTEGCEAPADVPALRLDPWTGLRSQVRVTGPTLSDEE